MAPRPHRTGRAAQCPAASTPRASPGCATRTLGSACCRSTEGRARTTRSARRRCATASIGNAGMSPSGRRARAMSSAPPLTATRRRTFATRRRAPETRSVVPVCAMRRPAPVSLVLRRTVRRVSATKSALWGFARSRFESAVCSRTARTVIATKNALPDSATPIQASAPVRNRVAAHVRMTTTAFRGFATAESVRPCRPMGRRARAVMPAPPGSATAARAWRSSRAERLVRAM